MLKPPKTPLQMWDGSKANEIQTPTTPYEMHQRELQQLQKDCKAEAQQLRKLKDQRLKANAELEDLSDMVEQLRGSEQVIHCS